MKILMYAGFVMVAIFGYQIWQASKEGASSTYWSTVNPYLYGLGGVAAIIIGGRSK
jgi:hypothetical protein